MFYKVSKSLLLAFVLAFTFGAMLQSSVRAQDDTTISIFLGSVGDLVPDQEIVDRWAAEKGVKVEFVYAPQSATDILAVIQQFLAAKSADVDIIQFDTIWPGILAPNMLDLAPYIESSGFDTASFYPRLFNNNIVDGKVVGLPWFTDAGLLYYRTDLLEKYSLEVPTTWDELTASATTIQEGERAEGLSEFYGFVYQANAYEGLTCDALEWQFSNGGGSIVEADGTISVNNPATIAALERAAGWVGTIAPEGVTTYQEEDARRVFQAGNAAFMRNWPYAYLLGQGGADGSAETAVKGLFNVAPLPAGDAGYGAAALGGWQLGVSAYSPNADLAAELVLYLVSPEVQKERALRLSNLPTIEALYTDAEIAEQIPFIAQLVPVFQNASPRPSTVTADKYNDVSVAYFTAVHSVLTGEAEAATAMEDLEVQLEDILGEGFTVGAPPVMPMATAEAGS